MPPLVLSVIALLANLSREATVPVAYATPAPSATMQSDCRGAGCMGEDGAVGCRSSGLSAPDCVGAGCMGN